MKPLTIAVAVIVLAAAGSAPAAAQDSRKFTPPTDAVGRAGPAGYLFESHDHAVRAARRIRRQGELTDAEIAELERRVVDRSADKRDAKGTEADVSRAYNEFWWDRGTKVTTNRSSLLIDPADGRVPPLTAEAQRRALDEWKQPALRGGGANGRGTDTLPIAASSSGASRAACPGRCRRAPTTTTTASCRARATSRSRSRCSAARGSFRPTGARTSTSTCASGWAIRAAIGRTTRSSSKRRTSRTRRCIAARRRTFA